MSSKLAELWQKAKEVTKRDYPSCPVGSERFIAIAMGVYRRLLTPSVAKWLRTHLSRMKMEKASWGERVHTGLIYAPSRTDPTKWRFQRPSELRVRPLQLTATDLLHSLPPPPIQVPPSAIHNPAKISERELELMTALIERRGRKVIHRLPDIIEMLYEACPPVIELSLDEAKDLARLGRIATVDEPSDKAAVVNAWRVLGLLGIITSQIPPPNYKWIRWLITLRASYPSLAQSIIDACREWITQVHSKPMTLREILGGEQYLWGDFGWWYVHKCLSEGKACAILSPSVFTGDSYAAVAYRDKPFLPYPRLLDDIGNYVLPVGAFYRLAALLYLLDGVHALLKFIDLHTVGCYKCLRAEDVLFLAVPCDITARRYRVQVFKCSGAPNFHDDIRLLVRVGRSEIKRMRMRLRA